MNRAQVATLLGAASAVDPRIPAPDVDVLAMWAAVLDDVPAEVAAEAVREHYRRRTETVMPADIVEHWRTVRRDAAEQRNRAELAARARQLDENGLRAIRAGIARVSAALAIARGAFPADAEAEVNDRRTYLLVPCPHCDAPPRQPCTGPGGRPLTKSSAHPARRTAVTKRGNQ